jgi:hypothetical protein
MLDQKGTNMLSILCQRFISQRNFGVELEVSDTKTQEEIKEFIKRATDREILVSGYAQTFGNRHWHVKTDSTCGPLGHGKDKGFEIASFIASGRQDLRDIGRVADALATGGVEVNNNCGLHVHVNIADFSPSQAGVLMARWIKIEPWIKQAVPRHRKNNKYSKFLYTARAKRFDMFQTYDALDFWNLLRPTNFSIYENMQKRVALNMINYAAALSNFDPYAPKRETAEFRFPEGTLSGREIVNWVRLFVMFVETSKDQGMPKNLMPAVELDQVLEILGFRNPDAFYLLDEDLYETKVWLLERMMTYGKKQYARLAEKNREVCVLAE